MIPNNSIPTYKQLLQHNKDKAFYEIFDNYQIQYYKVGCDALKTLICITVLIIIMLILFC